ncbi:type II toxin-antitoxin system RelE/ParE family toxin [Paucibacter sp. PLA-PC-4]|uniref:type II toxin-antitoxin system RelE/ParE family toxin n=1 Tax=Paucibacter sp. PLA-PC-4 TaxID=2993655 RepID=UPI002248822B|nr:type II toxin-antitoxin system RelE/ParE family toxin [Paucibacter sp. PLA-PC-4]MCX2862539.1 type II toxin-antitoxin system RelE/ParE family toxin [Paucibacter sp. PLA-PC-4]
MTRIELAPAVLRDFDLIFDHVAGFDPGNSPARIKEILQALQLLSSSPLIGRPVRGDKRALVIGRSTSGYVAPYRDVAELDTVFVLAVKHEREAGLGRSQQSPRGWCESLRIRAYPAPRSH